jgi:hypothetical protein
VAQAYAARITCHILPFSPLPWFVQQAWVPHRVIRFCHVLKRHMWVCLLCSKLNDFCYSENSVNRASARSGKLVVM